jgi:hypothetical protein
MWNVDCPMRSRCNRMVTLNSEYSTFYTSLRYLLQYNTVAFEVLLYSKFRTFSIDVKSPW